MTFRVTMLPARQGDALWLEWGTRPWRMLIDFGPRATGRLLRQRILNLDPAQRKFELLVVTHVDEDHIGGTLTGLIEPEAIDGLRFEDAWFNGWCHLDTPPSGIEAQGAVQGERFAAWVRERDWNRHFDGAPVMWQCAQRPIGFADGLTITVLGPSQERLAAMRDAWFVEVIKALRRGSIEASETEVPAGWESQGSRRLPAPPRIDADGDLTALAECKAPLDDAPANGSSIALLVEYTGERVLLGADAYGTDLVAAIHALRDGDRTRFDSSGRLQLAAFKLPHHGSMANVTRELVEAVDCRDWLVSTDGTRFHHPDASAIARVVRYASARPCRLHFNVRSHCNTWWDDADWRQRFGYETVYGHEMNGLTWVAGR